MAIILFGVLAIVYAAAAATDIRARKIPNYISFGLAGAALSGAAFDFSFVDSLLQAIGGLVLCLVLGTFAHKRRWIGGGDAKLLAASGAWVGAGGVLELIAVTALAGGIVSAIALVARGKNNRGVPYGVAISAGTISVLAWRLGASS